MYQKGGCFLALNDISRFNTYKKKIDDYLKQQCSDCLKDSISYSYKDTQSEAIYPLDTSHYCIGDIKIKVQGYDNIGYSSYSRSSSSRVGEIESLDSCYHIRQ